ncbi:MAG: carbohydrate ABC transporter permease [Nitrososphaerales archaeon]|jgi:ABC-type glycerol-3-phosphate transport system permease component
MSQKQAGRKAINVGRIPSYLFVGVWAATEIYVLLWAVMGSFRSTAQLDQNPFGIPTSINFNAYYDDLTGGGELHVPLGSFLVHSGIVVFGALAVILLVSIPAGYAISKRSRLNTLIFYLMLAMIAIPPAALLIPEVFLVRDLGLLNNFVGLILPYIAFNIPFSIVLARAFFRSFPKDLEEAGRMDGLGELGVFRRIVLPMSSIVVVVLLIVNFPALWNELLYTLIILSTNSVKTAQPGLLLYQGSYYVSWSNVFAGIILVSLPMLIFYIIFQRYILKAQFIGAIKG